MTGKRTVSVIFMLFLRPSCRFQTKTEKCNLMPEEATKQFGTTSSSQVRVFQYVPTPRWGTADQTHTLKDPLVGTQGYQRFPLSQPVVGRNIVLEDAGVPFLRDFADFREK